MLVTSGFTRRSNNPVGHMMAPREMPDIAAHRGMLPRTQALSPGARKLLRRIRTPTRFALAHCITSGLTQTNLRKVPMRRSASSRQGHLPLLRSRLPRAVPRRHPLPRPPRLQHRGQLQHLGRWRPQGLVPLHLRAPKPCSRRASEKVKSLLEMFFACIAST